MNIIKGNGEQTLTVTGHKGHIRTGDIVKVKIVRQLSNNAWQISLRGKLLPVTTNLPLSENMTVQTKAVWSGKQLILQILNQDTSIAAELGKSGIPTDATTQRILAALQRSGMPIKAETVLSIRKTLSQDEYTNDTLIRLLALVTDKDVVIPEKRFTELVHLLLSHREGQHENQEEKQRNKRQSEKESQDEEKKQGDTKTKIESALAENMISGKGPSLPALTLFNHIRADHDNWIILPFSLLVDETPFDGSVRIRTKVEKMRIQDLVIHVESQKAQWHFIIPNFSDVPKKMRIMCNNGSLRHPANRKIKKFSEKLRKLGIEVVDTIKEPGMFDGFSTEYSNTYHGIDAFI
jgi:hypothetical protein